MMKPHIFWILIDGVRYKPGIDKFGRKKIFYEFDKESVYFKKVITTAPSTLMSISAILTGRFAVELYPHFKYVNKLGIVYPTYIDVLKKHGYEINSSIFSAGAGKYNFKDQLNAIDLFPNIKTLNGKETLTEFKYIMKNRFDRSKPNILFAHMRCTHDSSDSVREMFKYLKKENLYDDSIIIMSSDHGYIDYGKLHHIGWALQPLTHSLYIDENSYRANLNIKFPDSLSKIDSKEIETPVSLIDMFETLFDYLGFEYTSENKKAYSLKKLIESNDMKEARRFKNRIHRVDNRYIMQNHFKTRVLDGTSTYTIEQDGNMKQVPKKFREFYEQTNQETMKTGIALVKKRFYQSELPSLKNKNIALYNYCNADLISFAFDELKKKNKVSVLDLDHIKKDWKKYDRIIAFIDNPYFYMYHRLNYFCNSKKIPLYYYDPFFDTVKYKIYNYFKETYLDSGMSAKHNVILKAGLYVILPCMKIKETLDLKSIKKNYHPLIRNM